MIENFKEEVGHSMKLLRIDKKITIEELAEKSGVATSTISKYENGKSHMDLDMVEKLVNNCGMPLDIFFKQIIAKMQ